MLLMSCVVTGSGNNNHVDLQEGKEVADQNSPDSVTVAFVKDIVMFDFDKMTTLPEMKTQMSDWVFMVVLEKERMKGV